MKTWGKYFDTKDEQINEDHKKGKEEQIKFISDAMNKMNKEDIEKLYKYIEDKFEVE